MPPPFEDIDPVNTMYASRLVGPQRVQEMTEAMLSEMQAEYLRMIDDILADQIAGDITPERANRLRDSLASILEDFADEFGGTLDGELRSFINEVARSHEQAGRAVATHLGVEFGQEFGQVDDLVMRQMMARRGVGLSASFQTIVDLQVQDMVNEIDDFLVSSVARGKGADRFKRELATLMAGDDDALREAINAQRTGSLLDLEDVSPEAKNRLEEADFMLHRSRTIAVSETNNAAWEADRYVSYESRVVGYVRWRLSGRHAAVPSSPDICDTFAYADPHGFGQGIYTPGTIPVRPHPNCACVMVQLTRPPDQWDDPRPSEPSEPGSVDETTIRTIFEERDGDPTDNKVESTTSLMNELMGRAHKTYRKVIGEAEPEIGPTRNR